MTIAVASPNIAFVKYWGKLPVSGDENRNIATNPSLSMTLSKAQTKTLVKKITASKNEILINGKPASEKDFEKISSHLDRICTELNRATDQKFHVHTQNNFPAGTGMASSASGFAALTLACLGEILGIPQTKDLLLTNLSLVSELARRGSGSASRSVLGGFVKWEGTSAVPVKTTWNLFDTVIVLSREPKKVSSSDGHLGAFTSPLFKARVQNIPSKLSDVENLILEKNLAKLGPLLESEALEMHAVAMTSQPAIHYLSPQTWAVIQKLHSLPNRDFFFTLDAGPNIHIISELPVKIELQKILADLNIEPLDYWEDHCGSGPELFEGDIL